MTTETMPEPPTMDIATAGNHALLMLWESYAEELVFTRDRIDRILFELKKRMETDGATAIADEEFTCKLDFPTPGVDTERLKPLLELVPDGELMMGYTPEHQETTTVPPRWDMRRVNTWKSFGQEVADIIEGAKLPVTPKVKISRKKEHDVPSL